MTAGADLWKKTANCDGISEPEEFPPNRGETIDEAKLICMGCVALGACYDSFLNTGVQTGALRVMSESEIVELLEQRRRAEELVLETAE